MVIWLDSCDGIITKGDGCMAIERQTLPSLPTLPALLAQGALGGLVAGIAFILAEIAMAGELELEMTAPVRLLATIALGPIALSPAYNAAAALVAGILVLLVLSSIYGCVFVGLLITVRQISKAPVLVVIYGAFFSFGVWSLNYSTVVPNFYPQFLMVDEFWMGFAPHVVYGVVLGAFVAAFNIGKWGLVER
jgi:hypothetical protein